MGWIIRKTSDPNRYLVNGDGELKATIISGAVYWVVVFEGAQALDCDDCPSFEWAAGYVRGIERAVAVHAKETRLGPRKPPRVLPRVLARG